MEDNMIILIKVIIDMVCGALNAIGGWHILWMRRYMIPITMGISSSLLTHIWWIGIMLLPCIGTLSMGYSKYGNFGRALWIGIQCLVLGIGLTLTHHVEIYFYIPYVIIGCVLGGLYRDWPQIIGDSITGCYFGTILFFVR